ncbi:MAG: histidine kinase [Crocinitomicaceae bacterium]|nr:histidine kinase [Crocinitomicaceae bacterium]
MLKAWFVAISLGVQLIIFGQAYNFQEISVHEGLPQSQAYAILFDSSQHAWIGTQGGGVCRYDGSDFEYYTKQDSLISNRIYVIKLINNEIWIGQKGGVTVFDQEAHFIKNYRLPTPQLVVQDITSFENVIYVATEDGLYRIQGDNIEFDETNVTLNHINIYSFFVADNELWLCSIKGLLNYKKPLSKLNKAKGLSADQVQCATVFGDFWVIGTYGGGVEVYSPIEGVLKANPFEELNEEIILSLFVANNTELWIGTMNNGIYVYNRKDGNLRNYKTTNGLSNNHVRAIQADVWDNIWIGTSGGGVSVFQNSPFIQYNTSSGLNGNYVYAELKSRRNDLWVATEGTAVVRINDTSVVTFDEEYGFVSEKVKVLFEDLNGDIWIGTEGKGLGIYSPFDGKDTVYRFTSDNGLPSDWIKCITQDPSTKTIYIGTGGGGLCKVNKDWQFPIQVSFKKVKPSNVDLPDRFSSLDYINKQLWFTSSEKYFGYYQNNKALIMTSGTATYRNCQGVYNKRWLGSADDGILEITMEGDSIGDQKWITVADGLSSNNIYQLIYSDSVLWVGTEKGLDKLSLDSNFNISSIQHFGYEEGFEGLETNINAAHIDPSGNLWFGTVNGLYQYQGGGVNYSQRKPPVLRLNDFSIFYESIEKTEFADFYEDGKMVKPLLLPYDMNHIGFMFKAIHYTYTKNIRYRWKLTGADPDWTPASTITTATYSNLPPGKYEFEVKASIDNNWDVEPVSISFEIDEPYYEKSWFKAMYYSAIGFVVLLIVLVIVMRLRRKNRALREKFELEKNMIELEQKALRLQMNPHFIFNVLTSIHNLIILNESDKARYALAKFSKLMRRVLENSREKFISIDDEIDTLENYVQLEKLTSNLDIELVIELDEDIDAAEEILPPLMIQPFVENAIIHGLKDLNKTGVIKVGFKLLNEHLLECYVEDNGKGRMAASEINSQKENYHKSTALRVTQERLAGLNKEADFVPFEIIDLKDEKGDPSGTKVVFRLSI